MCVVHMKQEMKMEELEKVSPEETKRTMNLADRIFSVIELNTDCTYKDVMRALDYIKCNYEKKGSDLLNSVSIREVAKHGGLLD